jgi:hypothetical protein
MNYRLNATRERVRLFLNDLTQRWGAQDYLQELRASIQALVRLRTLLVRDWPQPRSGSIRRSAA